MTGHMASCGPTSRVSISISLPGMDLQRKPGVLSTPSGSGGLARGISKAPWHRSRTRGSGATWMRRGMGGETRTRSVRAHAVLEGYRHETWYDTVCPVGRKLQSRCIVIYMIRFRSSSPLVAALERIVHSWVAVPRTLMPSFTVMGRGVECRTSPRVSKSIMGCMQHVCTKALKIEYKQQRTRFIGSHPLSPRQSTTHTLTAQPHAAQVDVPADLVLTLELPRLVRNLLAPGRTA